MNTFTNYAEKKAKQFLNLLQGYTRGIRMTAILILLLMGVSNAWAYSLYLYTGSFTSWEQDNVGFRIWDGSKDVEFTSLGNHWYRCETTQTGNTYFNRFSNNTNHNSFQVNISSTNNVVKVTDWGSGALTSLHITGNEWGGIGNWDNKNDGGKMAITSGSTFTKTFTNISNSAHKFKITFWGVWENAIAYNSSNVSCVNGTVKGDGTDNNIEFTPDNTGDVTITYNVSTGKVVITCAAPAENKFNVTAVANPTAGGTVTPTSATAMGQNSGGEITASAKTGYTFTNWTIKSGSGYFGTSGTNTTSTTANTKFRPTAIATVQANFTANEYTVTLDNQGATTAGTTSVTATYNAAMPSITKPTKTGYTFGGYYTSTNGGGTQYYTANGASARTWNIAENTTLYAKWTANQYTITYKDQGNVAFSGTHASTPPTKHTYGTATTLKTATKTGYTFDGWHTDAACTNKVTSLGATAYTANITLYAKWTATPTTIYLKPGLPWKKDDARFAIYAWGDNAGDKWVDMTAIGCNEEYYVADVPAGYSQFKFVRLNPANKDHNFNDGTCWNQTTNLTLPTNGNNLYDLTKIYLKPNANWKSDGARFAAYFFHSDYGDDKAWMSMLNTDENGVLYYCDVPTDKLYNKVSFVRMNGEQSTNDWSYRLNQSKDIDLFNGSIVWYR